MLPATTYTQLDTPLSVPPGFIEIEDSSNLKHLFKASDVIEVKESNSDQFGAVISLPNRAVMTVEPYADFILRLSVVLSPVPVYGTPVDAPVPPPPCDSGCKCGDK